MSPQLATGPAKPPDHRPLIGITTRTVIEGHRVLEGVERDYTEAVAGAGGLPLLLAQSRPGALEATVDAIDGLLLSGGGDVDPSRYDQQSSAEVSDIDTDRDDWEIALAHRAREVSLPILGICRGCQVLNVAAGGSLIQHLPNVTAMQHLVVHPRDRISHELVYPP